MSGPAIQELAGERRAGEDALLELSLGPHHPSTHGVFRMDVVLDGERVMKLKPVFGYLHRNHEKIAETASYLASMPYTDRLDYIGSLTNNWAYALAVEKLAGIEVPERAEYIRVITAELTRLQNHASTIGFLTQEMGASGSPLMYSFREREKILDLFEALTGSRMMCNYMRFGGCRVDLPAGWMEQARKVVAEFPRFLDEFERLLTGNEILMARTQGVGVLSKELAIQGGITGPILRASGVNYDIRKVDKYGIYERFDFKVPLGAHGDVYDRYMVRVLEMRESVKILNQALRDIPAGPILDAKTKIRGFRPKAGEAYGRIESAKGRAWVFPDQRRDGQSLSIPGASAEPDQSDGARGYVCWIERGGHDCHVWHDRYCVGRGGSVDCRCGRLAGFCVA